MDTARLIAYALFGVTVLFIGSSFVTPFAGYRPEDFPIPQDDPPAQPAGYAFAIWGVIYLWLLGSAVFGALQRAKDAAWTRARKPLIASLGVGMFWLAIASQSPLWATLMIWGMFSLALWALVVAPRSDRWLFRAPVALYAGWLAAASSVSLGLIGGGYGLFWGEIGWAAFVAILATLIAIAVLLRVPDTAEFGIAVTWALIAVAVKSAQDATGIALIAGLSAMGIGVLAIISATKDTD